MKWVQYGSRFLSPPYQLIGSIRGWEAWQQEGKQYTVLTREIQSLRDAKKFCQSHSDKAKGEGDVNELEDIRRRLEEVAEDFGNDSEWGWDRTRMHLTISDPKGNPIATLHVERYQ